MTDRESPSEILKLADFGLLRALKWHALSLTAQIRALLPFGSLSRAPTFVLGCGRSGTTALGRCISFHRDVVYLNEPIHYWHAIDRRTDFLDFFGSRGQCFLTAADVTAMAKRRFGRLFGQAQGLSGRRTVVCKHPGHSLRMGWLDGLDPTARFIHIIRDGRAVARSISELARDASYRVFGKSDLNRWWGRRCHKWHTLARECRQRDLLVDAIDTIGEPTPDRFESMSAIEWLVRIRQVRESVAELGLGADRFLEVRYEELTADPATGLAAIQRFIGVAPDEHMVDTARQFLRLPRSADYSLVLPQAIHDEFVATQKSLGYSVDGVHCASDNGSSERRAVVVV